MNVIVAQITGTLFGCSTACSGQKDHMFHYYGNPPVTEFPSQMGSNAEDAHDVIMIGTSGQVLIGWPDNGLKL